LKNLSSFVELGVSAPVVRALERRGFKSPFPIQRLVMRDALAGVDVLAKSQTGSGKTHAFAIPIVESLQPSMPRPSALVLVPTRELAVQVTEELRGVAVARNLRVASVYGGVPIPKQAERAAKAHVVVATPGRLLDLSDRRLISVEKVRILVLDEADRMLDMGFQPQVDKIVARVPEERQTMFFSATLEGVVGHVARRYTNNPARHEVQDRRPVVKTVAHRFVAVDGPGKLDKLIDVLKEKRELALVFVATKRGADRLKIRLRAKGVEALALHGDMSQSTRQRALERFTDGKIDVLIGTDVAARGLDIDGISHVINYDPPRDHKDYVHRVGRTARAGQSGTGVTFVGAGHRQEMSAIARQLQLNEEFEADGLKLAAPRIVFSSHGSRSMMRPRRRSRL
jgi:ATP-dependent RNA helicase RhlE